MLSEISQSQRQIVPRAVTFWDTEGGMVLARGWGRGNGLMGTEFQFSKVERVWRLVVPQRE